jgi:hypothetical protein
MSGPIASFTQLTFTHLSGTVSSLDLSFQHVSFILVCAQTSLGVPGRRVCSWSDVLTEV